MILPHTLTHAHCKSLAAKENPSSSSYKLIGMSWFQILQVEDARPDLSKVPLVPVALEVASEARLDLKMIQEMNENE